MRTPFFNHERACVWILWGIFPSLILKQITLFKVSKNQNRAQLGQSMCSLNMWQMQRKLQRCHYKCLWRQLRSQMLLFRVFRSSECVLWSPSREEVWFNLVRNRTPPNLSVVVCAHCMAGVWGAGMSDSHRRACVWICCSLYMKEQLQKKNKKKKMMYSVKALLSKKMICRCVLPWKHFTFFNFCHLFRH